MESTTLHMAAAGGHSKIVKVLLENGANPENENAVNFLIYKKFYFFFILARNDSTSFKCKKWSCYNFI